jgi:hypothetical protein
LLSGLSKLLFEISFLTNYKKSGLESGAISICIYLVLLDENLDKHCEIETGSSLNGSAMKIIN